jgi:hypothetical protein
MYGRGHLTEDVQSTAAILSSERRDSKGCSVKRPLARSTCETRGSRPSCPDYLVSDNLRHSVSLASQPENQTAAGHTRNVRPGKVVTTARVRFGRTGETVSRDEYPDYFKRVRSRERVSA